MSVAERVPSKEGAEIGSPAIEGRDSTNSRSEVEVSTRLPANVVAQVIRTLYSTERAARRRGELVSSLLALLGTAVAAVSTLSYSQNTAKDIAQKISLESTKGPVKFDHATGSPFGPSAITTSFFAAALMMCAALFVATVAQKVTKRETKEEEALKDVVISAYSNALDASSLNPRRITSTGH